MNTSFFKTAILSLSVLTLVSCDKDFNEIGADIIGEDHFDFELFADTQISANVVATGAVQSNNLDINPLGIYENNVFGKVTANFVTQLELATTNPTFTVIDEQPEILEVKLYVPYFSDYKSTNADGDKIYELDSIFPADQPSAKMKLSVHESGYFLRDRDHSGELEEVQRYYTDLNSAIDLAKNPVRLNDNASASQNDAFAFSASEISNSETDDEGEEVITKELPGMQLLLNKEFFQNKIFQAPAGSLQNNNTFKNYFRGLYFKMEDDADGAPGQLAMMNFKNGKITIKYEEDKSTVTTVGGVSTTIVTRVKKTLVLNFAGNTVSLLENENAPDYVTNLATPISVEGPELLYIKGGQGSVATIDLFGADADNDQVPDQLEEIRANKWLINEANLIFYIDQVKMEDVKHEPQRLYLYDVNNKRPIVDYYLDNNTGGNPKLIKKIHDGMIKVNADKRGTEYKIRLTNYIKDVISNDSTNVRLGLSVTESIGIVSMVKTKLPNPNNAQINSYIPTASVMNPLGTILYGTGAGAPPEKRLRLEIYYTKSN